MTTRLVSVAKWLGTIFLTCFCEYLLNQYGIYRQIKTLFAGHSGRLITFINRPIPLWEIAVFFMLVFVFYLSINKLVAKKKMALKKDISPSTQEIFYKTLDSFKEKHKYNKIEENDSVIFQTDLGFRGNNLFINWVHPYCVKHDNKARMTLEDHVFKCYKTGCGNRFLEQVNITDRVKTEILSTLENEWDKLGVVVDY